MEEKEILANLKQLKNTNPNKDWVLFTKQKILSSQPVELIGSKTQAVPFYRFLLRPRFSAPIFASILLITFFSLSFTIAQNALPGEPLYSLKKMAEKIELTFVPVENEPVVKLELTQERLKELEQVTQTDKNQGRKLAASILETQKAITDLSKTLSQTPKEQQEKIAPKIIEKVVNLKIQTETIEKTINADIINENQKQELDNSLIEYYKYFIANFFADLENSSLTLKEIELLNQAKEFYNQGEINKTLEIINQIYNQK